MYRRTFHWWYFRFTEMRRLRWFRQCLNVTSEAVGMFELQSCEFNCTIIINYNKKLLNASCTWTRYSLLWLADISIDESCFNYPCQMLQETYLINISIQKFDALSIHSFCERNKSFKTTREILYVKRIMSERWDPGTSDNLFIDEYIISYNWFE